MKRFLLLFLIPFVIQAQQGVKVVNPASFPVQTKIVNSGPWPVVFSPGNVGNQQVAFGNNTTPSGLAGSSNLIWDNTNQILNLSSGQTIFNADASGSANFLGGDFVISSVSNGSQIAMSGNTSPQVVLSGFNGGQINVGDPNTTNLQIQSGDNGFVGAILTGTTAFFQVTGGPLFLSPQSLPASPQEGYVYGNSTDHHPHYYDGTSDIPLGNPVITHNTSTPATFNTTGLSETIYDDSTLLTALTIALPSTTLKGQILRYVSKGGVTTVTVTGTVDVGAALTTLAANGSVAWQAISLDGHFIRIQ